VKRVQEARVKRRQTREASTRISKFSVSDDFLFDSADPEEVRTLYAKWSGDKKIHAADSDSVRQHAAQEASSAGSETETDDEETRIETIVSSDGGAKEGNGRKGKDAASLERATKTSTKNNPTRDRHASSPERRHRQQRPQRDEENSPAHAARSRLCWAMCGLFVVLTLVVLFCVGNYGGSNWGYTMEELWGDDEGATKATRKAAKSGVTLSSGSEVDAARAVLAVGVVGGGSDLEETDSDERAFATLLLEVLAAGDIATTTRAHGGAAQIFHPALFRRTRAAFDCEVGDGSFVHSLSKGLKFSGTGGGKSGSRFFKTRDGRFWIKQQRPNEFKLLVEDAFVQDYVAHVEKFKATTLIARMVMVFRFSSVKLFGGIFHHNEGFFVTPSVFPDVTHLPPHFVYDLKGALHGHLTKKENYEGKTEVFLM
jgi:hypothetical protein